jgi:sulfur-carrier protein
MKIRIRYFASLREALGAGEEASVADGLTVGALRAQLVARGGAHAELLAGARPVRAAVNQTMATESAELSDGAEVAFFPPVTGG